MVGGGICKGGWRAQTEFICNSSDRIQQSIDFFHTNYLPEQKEDSQIPEEHTMDFPFPLVSRPSDNLTSHW